MSVTLATLTIQNPGFETGDLTHWTAKAGASTPPTGTDAAIQAVTTFTNGIFTDHPHSGSYFLWAGGQSRYTRVYQDYDVTAYAASIDNGGCVISGLSGWFISRVDEFDSGQLLAEFLDVSNATISTTLGTVNRATAVWVQTTLATTAVPVGTRKIRIGCHNERNFGLNNDAFWDDFTGPDLINTTALTFNMAVTFEGLSDFRLSSTAAVEMAITFAGTSTLTLSPSVFPLFNACIEPPAKTWARTVPVAKDWACVAVVPAEECDGIDNTTGDDLELSSGDRLVTVDGYGLRLVS